MRNMKKTAIAVLLTSLAFSSLFVAHSVFAKAIPGADLTYTTLDVKKDYEILQVIGGFSQIQTEIAQDPFAVAQANAWRDIMKQAADLDADAVVGIRMEFENLTRDNVGRLIIYGTAVKYTEE